jgi:hypothetical protein
VAAHLQQIEGGRVEEEERHKVESPHKLMHKRLAAKIPEWDAIISVIDEVHEGHSSQWQADSCKYDSVGPCTYQLFTWCMHTPKRQPKPSRTLPGWNQMVL